MQKELCAIVGSLLMLLAACQSPTNATEIQKEGGEASPAPEMQQPHSSTSLCTSEQVPVLSCKLKASGKIASLCAASSSDDVWRFRLLYGDAGQPPTAAFPLQGTDDGRGFNRSRLMLFGGAGGLVYSTVSDGQRYALYSIQGKGFSRAGLQISPPGAEMATSDDECLTETLIESDDNDLLEAVDRWNSDPTFENKGLPGVDTQR
jgi:hypothetical protein